MQPLPNSTLPPGQQLVAPGKWPLVGERMPAVCDAPWTVSIGGLAKHPIRLGLAELRSLPQVELEVDIHCVTRWSKPGVRFRGVSLAQFLQLAAPSGEANFVSFVARSDRQHSTSLSVETALSLGTLLALEVDGQPLPVEHGGPVRVVVPGRYFYKSLKWLASIELLAEDRLGYWEANSGYHNEADPWRQQRYIPARRTPADARRTLAALDIHGQDLLGLPAAGLALAGLQAQHALLRDADFRGCDLSSANFDGANLTNAHLEGANLRGASFRDADLEGAALQGADLRGAVLLAASIVATSFCDDVGGHCSNISHIDSTTEIDLALLDQLTPIQASCMLQMLSNPASTS